MSPTKPAMSKEEQRKRLENFSFSSTRRSITSEHEICRERAAVRVEFHPGNLVDPNVEPSAPMLEAIQKTLDESTLVDRADRRPAWRLNHEVRHQTFQRLAREGRLEIVSQANPSDYPSTIQEILDAYILGNAPPLNAQNLDQVEATLPVVEWLEGALKDLPSITDIRRQLAWKRLLSPFHFLVGSHFQGRQAELGILREYVSDPSEAASAFERTEFRPLLIYGSGGIGKSTLISKFILEFVDLPEGQRLPFVYLDFNRRSLRIQDPVSILLEVARQMSIQFPAHESTWSRLEQEWQRRMAESDSRAPDSSIRSKYSQEAYVSSRQREWDRFVRELGDALSQFRWSVPFLVVLDTFEELQYYNSEYLDSLFLFLEFLQQQIPSLRPVLSGRSPLQAKYPVHELFLEGLDPEGALRLLMDRGIPNAAIAEQIIEVVGRSPLSLWLAADLFRLMEGDRKKAFEDLEIRQEYFYRVKEHLIQGVLYRRILGHIHNERVKKLVHPGMVLRRISPELIQHVLAETCGIEIENLEEAKKLFAELQQEISVVEINQANPNELRQRPELRLVLLELLLQDDQAVVREIHRRAADYFGARVASQTPPNPRDRADETYHRLALDEDPSFLDSLEARELQAIAEELGADIQDLPVLARTYLASRAQARIQLSPEDWAAADLKSWEQNTARQVQRLLDLGRYDQALSQLAGRSEWSSGSPLYPLKAVALISLKRKEEAWEELEEGVRRTPPNSPEMQSLLLLTATLNEQERQFADAMQYYRRALAVAERLKDETNKLQIQLNLLRMAYTLYPTGSAETQRESQALLADWKSTSDETLLKEPILIRDVATQLAGEAPEVVARAVRLVGLGNDKPTNLTSLANALTAWDEDRSIELKEPEGVLARQIRAEMHEGQNLFVTWISYLEATAWTQIAQSLMYLLETHPLPANASYALVDLIKSRLLLTTRQGNLCEAILQEIFSLEELRQFLQTNFEAAWQAVGKASTFERLAADLVSWAESNGKLAELLLGLIRIHPNQPELLELLRSLGIESLPAVDLTDDNQAIKYYESSLTLARARKDAELEADALAGLGEIYERQNKLREAKDVYQQAVDARAGALGRDHPLVASDLAKLGDVLLELGEGSAARAAFEESLTISTRAFGEEHRIVAFTTYSLGQALEMLGDLKGAASLVERAIVIEEKILGPDHSELAPLLSRLGALKLELGDLPGARIACERTLAIDEAALGPDHQVVAQDAHFLGSVLYRQGEIASAVQFFERALTLAHKAQDLATEGIVMGKLGNAYAAVGKLDEAIDLYRRRLELARQQADRNAEAITLSNLGTAYHLKGDLTAATNSYEQALNLARELNDTRTQGSVSANLGLVYAEVGETARAASLYTQSLEIARRTEDLPSKLTALANLGLVSARRGEIGRSLQFYNEAIELAKQIGDQRTLANTLGNLGLLYLDTEPELEKAIKHFEESLAIFRQVGDRRGEANAMGNLGLAYSKGNQPEKAIRFFEDQSHTAEAIGDHRGQANARLNLANALFEMRSLKEAGAEYRKALRIALEVNDRSREADSRLGLGLVDLEKGDPSRARENLEVAVKIYREAGLPDLSKANEYLQRAIEQESAAKDQYMSFPNIQITGNQNVNIQQNVVGEVRGGVIAGDNVKMDSAPSEGRRWKHRAERFVPTICLAELRETKFTAFLVGPDLVLTSYHAIRDLLNNKARPKDLILRFDLLSTSSSEILSHGVVYPLATGTGAQLRLKLTRPWLAAFHAEIGYALLRLSRPAGEEIPGGLKQGKSRGWLPLSENFELRQGDPLGMLAFRRGHVAISYLERAFINLSRNDDRLYHLLESEPGAAGAPILNAQLEVVAVQIGRDPEKRSNEGGASVGGSALGIVKDLKKKGLWPLV